MAKVIRVGQNSTVKFDMSKLMLIRDQLERGYVTRVGVLGGKTNREAVDPNETKEQYKKRVLEISRGKKSSSGSHNLTNADIGLIHEKGSLSRNIPRRSFLEMPLQLKLPDYYKVAFPRFIQALSEGNVRKAYIDLGIKGEQIVQQAFASGGYGVWPKLTKRTRDNKGSDAILIDTAQLRRSITSDVKTK